MKYIEIEPLNRETTDSDCVRRCRIKRIDGDVQVDQTELWFQFDKSIVPPEDNDCDSYLLAVIMDAMKEERDVIVKGEVSKQLLSNLVEYQVAWYKWLPDLYSYINISAESIRDNSTPVSGAICAFSGGVDATFSVWRHSQAKFSHRSQDIKLCSIVHGFDIPLREETSFNNASKRAQETLKDIQLKLVPIKTNYREITTVNWEHAFSCVLVAVLSNFKKVAGTCIVGSSEPYDSLVIPWGSSPITDHLLSSGDFHVIHDGASHNRTEKVKEICDWKVGIENLRVCWQGDLKDRNCGKCEKCVRTKLNFLATGNPIPICFPDSNILDDIKEITLPNEAVRGEWRQIYEYANKNEVKDSWVGQLRRTLNKKSLIDKILPKGSPQREIVKNLTRKISGR
ncbi:hypothetical protein [Moorena sp. SIO2C4]|uniref:hypothetical protein n=1 Tax=Moorena sp. SIO2C4 TaxID=2607824 RepID=UPI0013CD5063|nr:hypothetical protein [Moorena sp. SIO2C4]NES42742.1 hypothetical protein [Moorena sp. SIO2C4]